MSTMTNHRLRQQLLARLSKRFDIVTRELRVGPIAFPFTSIRNPDTVLDAIVDEADRREKLSGRPQTDDELHLPYWAELWDSAYGVGEFLCANYSALSTEHSALDLGCGMGLAGTVAAALGLRVMLADLEPDALLFARLNAQQFGCVRVRRLDWRRERLDESFDLILGADVLYDKSQWPFLEPFWRAHLNPRGEVILGEPGRQTGELFIPWLEARGGWGLERSSVTVVGREKPIRLLRLFRRS
jgi:predicted nicotinamide N-methyase